MQAAGENSGFTNEQSPQGEAFSRDLLDQKSKSLLFPRCVCVCVGGGGGGGGGGSWLHMTTALMSLDFNYGYFDPTTRKQPYTCMLCMNNHIKLSNSNHELQVVENNLADWSIHFFFL